MYRVAFDRWIISVDVEATSLAYASLAYGDATDCGCADCRNWIEQRSTVFPLPFRELVSSFGIDYSKETEVSEYESGALDPSLNLYCGEYLFLGCVDSGPDCYVIEPGGTCRVEVFPMYGDLKVGFSSNGRLATRHYPSFPMDQCCVLVFQVHAKRGSTYAHL